ncbi:SRPBCC family protein [Niveibacterium sp. SC-1]|uniref:SRPBCC family protein n=1 Tax=Niveibacterium sp. SC-1 TaxID=3135646 RepID=UPI00311EFB3D
MNAADTKPVAHGSFTLERRFPAPPGRVFAAWTDPAIKQRWFTGPPHWTPIERSLDVRVGGTETLHGRFEGAQPLETRFTARYHEVLPDTRLVYAYDMHLNGQHHSVSLATVEFVALEGGTRMRYTEQIVFLDGTPSDQGVPSRQGGTESLLDRMAQLFAHAEAQA